MNTTPKFIIVISLLILFACNEGKSKRDGPYLTEDSWETNQLQREAYIYLRLLAKERSLLLAGIDSSILDATMNELINSGEYRKPWALVGDSLKFTIMEYDEYKRFRLEHPIDSMLLIQMRDSIDFENMFDPTTGDLALDSLVIDLK